MSRFGRWIFDEATRQLIDAAEYRARIAGRRAVSRLPRPSVIGDTIPETRSMIDGNLYTSKAALRSTYLPSGNERGERFVEVGNEEPKLPPKPAPDRQAVRYAARRALSKVGIST